MWGSTMISIIIPLFNGERVIENCIASILNSSKYCDYEILIIDDGSTDNSAEVVKKYTSSNIILLKNNRNLGFVKTVMKGISKARGDIIVLLNMDTIVAHDWLAELIRPLQTCRTIGITGSKMFSMDGDNIQHAGGFLDENALSHHIGKGEQDSDRYNQEKEVEYVCGASMACRKELFNKIGGLDLGYAPMYYEEIDVAHKFRKAGYKIKYIPSSRLRHHGEYALQNNRDRLFYFSTRNRLRYILKTYPVKKVLFTFLYNEVKYYNTISNKQRAYLLRAYFYTISKLPEILLARLSDRILINRIRLQM